MFISVIICTHNPRPDYLARVLEALRAQTLRKDQWELVLIDNASKEPITSTWDLSWHPAARHVSENELGLTPARLRGIRESKGTLLVFVDDDNVLSPGYLEETLRISQEFPMLGVWGGGTEAEYEESPPHWFSEKYAAYIGVRKIKKNIWSNLRTVDVPGPIGAGMTVRKPVAEHYALHVAGHPVRKKLDRSGSGLGGCGDIDIVYVAISMGFGKGLFESLQLTHLISGRRLASDYFWRLVEETSYSITILTAIWGDPLPKKRAPKGLFSYLRHLRELLRQNQSDRRFHAAYRRGIERARQFINDNIAHFQDPKTCQNANVILL